MSTQTPSPTLPPTSALPTVNNYPVILDDQDIEQARDMFYRYLVSGKYCDLKITCRNRTFDVHKIVISAGSKVFAAMIDGYFKEGQTSHIDLPEDDPTTIRLLIQFIYLGTYFYSPTHYSISSRYGRYLSHAARVSSDDYPPLQPLESISCKAHAQLYAVADKYDVPDLFNMTAEHYRDRAFERRKGVTLKDHKYIDFLDSIPTVYNTPSHPNGNDLRTLASNVMAYFSDNLQLCAQGSPALMGLREQIMKDIPEFTFDVALKLMKNASIVCGSCVEDYPRKTHEYELASSYCSICGENKAFCRNNSGKDLLE